MKYKVSWICLVSVALVYVFIPFSFFVDVEYVDFKDMCVGDKEQSVHANRTSILDVDGISKDRMIYFTNGLRIETDITRTSASFIYEKDSTEATYDITWNKAPTLIGTYGVQSDVVARPFWFWPIEDFFPVEDTFEVKNCI